MTETPRAQDRTDVRQIVAVARRRWWLPLVCMVLVGGAAWIFSASQQKQYTATASVLLQDSGLEESLLSTAVSPPSVDPTRQALTDIQIVSSPAVTARTAAALRLPETTLANALSVSAVGQTNVVQVGANAVSPSLAARIANGYADQAVTFTRATARSQISEMAAAVQGRLRAMKPAERRTPYGQLLAGRAQELQALASAETGGAQVISRAVPPESPSYPKAKRNVVIGLLLGLILGTGAAGLAERWNRRIRDVHELGQMQGLRVLGAVPLTQGRSHTGIPSLDEWQREPFRMILAKLQHATPGGSLRSLLVTSAGPGEGKSTVAWNLAETLALRGRERVLFIETDLRHPTVAARHNLDWTLGLADALAGSASFDRIIKTVRLPSGSFEPKASMDVIAAGPATADPVRLLESTAMRELLIHARERYDVIVLDSAPALATPDVMPLLSGVDGVLLVSRADVTTRDDMLALTEEMSRLGAPVVGVVINAMKSYETSYRYRSDQQPFWFVHPAGLPEPTVRERL